MSTSTHRAKLDSKEPTDFSLFLGGPLFQLWRRAKLSGDALQWLRRRVLAMTLLAWLPLLLLSIAEGTAWGDSVKISFLTDAELQIRFLIALPLLIVAELIVHQRMIPVVRQFRTGGLVPEESLDEYDAAVTSALRWRNSIPAELLLIAFVYTVGVWFIWRTHAVLDCTNWYNTLVAGKTRPSLAGLWFGFVSLPLFQFLFLRWYYRLFIWARFLWQMSRIDLRIVPTHPDRCGGLGFLTQVSYAFTPLLMAQGALLAGLMANQIFFKQAKLTDFKMEIIGTVVVMVFSILAPLLVFAPKLAYARRAGEREYGALAQRYAQEFDHKWIRGGAAKNEPLIGSSDIQSLADMGNSFEGMNGMKILPFTLRTVAHLAVCTLIPIVPLTLTMFSVGDLIDILFKLAF